MKVSVNWLRQFVEMDETPEEIADILTMQAFELEDFVPVRRYLEGVKVGKVLESKKHPDADRLSVTKVDIGGEVLPIVCGAPNCREGLTVAVAEPGTKVGDITLDTRKIRGETSAGMILSELEMNISGAGEGILELDGDAWEVGQSLESVAPLDDVVLDFEVTVNRPDALSHLGIARELAAHFRRPLKRPSWELKEADRPASDVVSVEIQDPEMGPRYLARMVEGVQVGPSPLWLKALLHSLGQRPINNVVDVTNYVLFELGHPLHAFDFRLVKQGRVIVRAAQAGETITTLDDKERKLRPDDLLIADPEGGIALAGVMGGANTEVDERADNILIEAAYFDPPTVRRTAKHHNLSTEASRRFERGADPSMVPHAAARCARLIQELAGGDVLQGAVDACPASFEPRLVDLRPSRAAQVLGYDIGAEQAKEALEALELDVVASGDDRLKVTVPTARHDLEREVDLIEEVARIVGYDKVPTATTSRVVLSAPDSHLEDLVDTAADTMAALGFREAVNTNMTSGADQAAFSRDLEPVAIHRPLNPEMNVYRASLLPALLRTTEYNLNRGFENVRFFEVGQAGGKGWLGEDAGNRTHLAWAMTGAALPPAFDRAAPEIDLSDVKSVIIGLAAGLTLDMPTQFGYDTPGNLAHGVTLRDGAGKLVLSAGMLEAETAAQFGLDQPVFVGEVDLERWAAATEEEVHRPGIRGEYQPFSRQPAIVRDIALVVEPGIQAGKPLEAIREYAGKGSELVEEVRLFDLYEGKPLAEGERSLAFRVVFRAEDRTLTDEEVDPVVERIVERVKQQVGGVRLRSREEG